MKNLLKGSLAVGVALGALSANSNAQTVAVKGLGSSAIFLELGLAAASATNATPAGLGATCLWTENTSSVAATDTSAGTLTDSGNAFVAWTPGTGTCAAPVNPTIYSYLQTDSVVGNRCLFNGAKCTIAYPTTNPATANLIYAAGATPGEVALPTSIANALNSAAVNVAGTDIRPEDAEFAIARALKPCGTAVASGSQYLGLGYANGTAILASTQISTTSKFNVINFSLPASFSVTPVGATPVVVVVNSPSATTGFNIKNGTAFTISSIPSANLAKFLDGSYGLTTQAENPATTTGGVAVTTVVREPLSGTYNTMEYNVPNTVATKTSQDVGLNQPTAQRACNGTSPINPLTLSANGGTRERAIGTGQELSTVQLNANDGNVLGYSFWSVGNFKNFNGTGTSAFARYLQVDGIDPLLKSGVAYTTYNGTIPTAGSAEIANVDLSTTGSGSYPIWSQLRLVNAGSTPLAAVTSLATTSQNFVSKGTTTSRPDYVQASLLSVVRSHFIPPAGVGEPTTAANGHGTLTSSACTAPEAGGDVGGVVYTLAADSRYCSTHGVTTGETGMRR